MEDDTERVAQMKAKSKDRERQSLLANEAGVEETGAGAAEDETGHLMNFYDQLFRQYGVERPDGILDASSVSSGDTMDSREHSDFKQLS